MKNMFLKSGYTDYGIYNNKYNLLQKCIKDNFGKKYYINIKIYSLIHEIKPYLSYSADVQFNMNSEKDTFNVDLLDVKSVEQVESFFENIFQTLKCDYYEKYNE
jgi:hypothetical protein